MPHANVPVIIPVRIRGQAAVDFLYNVVEGQINRLRFVTSRWGGERMEQLCTGL